MPLEQLVTHAATQPAAGRRAFGKRNTRVGGRNYVLHLSRGDAFDRSLCGRKRVNFAPLSEVAKHDPEGFCQSCLANLGVRS